MNAKNQQTTDLGGLAGKNTPQTVGLEDLKKVASSIKFKAPKLGKLPDVTGRKATIDEKIAAVAKIREDVPNALKFLRDVQGWISQYSGDRMTKKIAEAEYAKDVKDMEQYLSDVLTDGEIFYRQAAAGSYIQSVLSGDFKSLAEAQRALKDLADRSLLIKIDSGPIIIGFVHYKVSDSFGMEAEDLKELEGIIANFSQKLKTLVYQRRQEDEKTAQEQITITFDEAMDKCANGKCLIEVPPQPYLDKGVEKWRAGGKLFAEFDADDVTPLKGIGGIEKLVSDMVLRNVRLPCHTLDKRLPPGTNTRDNPESFGRAKNAIKNNFGLDDEAAQRYLKMEQVLWHLIQRGDSARRAKKEMAELKEKFRASAGGNDDGINPVTPVQLFGLNGDGGPVTGKTLLEFEGAFRQQNGPDIYELFFEVTTLEEDGKMVLMVTRVPEHLKPMLGELVGQRFPTENNFMSCPPELGRIIRGIRGQVEMAHEVGKKK